MSVVEVVKVHAGRRRPKSIVGHPRIDRKTEFAEQEAVRVRTPKYRNYGSGEVDGSFNRVHREAGPVGAPQ